MDFMEKNTDRGAAGRLAGGVGIAANVLLCIMKLVVGSLAGSVSITADALNNLSDERTEYLINDRLSFMRFLGLGLSERVPDAKTVWLFRERLTQAGAIDVLFNRFDATLRNAGYLPMSGQILDATLVAAPKQRNTNEEKADLREGLDL